MTATNMCSNFGGKWSSLLNQAGLWRPFSVVSLKFSRAFDLASPKTYNTTLV